MHTVADSGRVMVTGERGVEDTGGQAFTIKPLTAQLAVR